MADHKGTVDALAALIDEFGLAEARLQTDGLTVAFRQVALAPVEGAQPVVQAHGYAPVTDAPAAESEKGTPITSPMTGVYYSTPSPNAPPYVKVGDAVTAGQVVALIEAMKVMNEVTATASGTVLKVVAESGQLVQPGDVLVLVG